jgi:hypothetical protein
LVAAGPVRAAARLEGMLAAARAARWLAFRSDELLAPLVAEGLE